MDRRIQTLRTFFRISTAAFTFVNEISAATGKHIITQPMETMHRLALSELEKENPDMQEVDYLLAQMEELATQNAANNG